MVTVGRLLQGRMVRAECNSSAHFFRAYGVAHRPKRGRAAGLAPGSPKNLFSGPERGVPFRAANGDHDDRASVGWLSAAMKERMKITSAPLSEVWLRLAAVVCLTASSGCTSVISSAYLREAWLDAVEHAAEARADEKTDAEISGRGSRDADDSAATAASSTSSDANDAPAAALWSPATLDEAVEEAENRLSQSGGLNEAARGTLIAMLKSTPRQDWPVVVEEFTAALAAAHVDSNAGSAAAATAAEPVAPLPPAEIPVEKSVEAPPATAAESGPNVAEPEPVQPLFAVQNACFASRVRAWGVVDRFETAEFVPGQELIVYFELDQLASRPSAEGHTTRIDTVLRLVGGDGRRVHEWTFEPLEETCGGHRHDYFARYLVALPASIPAGPSRLEIGVTDTIAGRTAHASLPLTVSDR